MATQSNIFDMFHGAITAFRAISAEPPYRIVMHPLMFEEVLKVADELGSYAMPLPNPITEQPRIWGIPVVLRESIASGTVEVLGEGGYRRMLAEEEWAKR